ncbi:IS3 family transposase [Phaeobacter sp. BS52]|uniref:IS3 family transposase n=1 Tax=Phaeobacter sp. BS52 TaxID=2907241 RepID=UPI00386F7EEA
MDDHLRSKLCCDALNMALGRRGPVPGLIHHSDRGVQYAGSEYRALLGSAKIIQSMSRTGECLDNAPMESFFASLKKELVHQERFKTRSQAKAAIFEYIEVFYNRQRQALRHSLPNPRASIRNHDLEKRSIGSIINLSGNRGELQLGRCGPSGHSLQAQHERPGAVAMRR